jgi:hypothetical protein
MGYLSTICWLLQVPDGEVALWYEVLHLPLFYLQVVRERRLTLPFEEDALVRDLQADQHTLAQHLGELYGLVQVRACGSC